MGLAVDGTAMGWQLRMVALGIAFSSTTRSSASTTAWAGR